MKITDIFGIIKNAIASKLRTIITLAIILIAIGVLVGYFFKKEPKESVKREVERIVDIKKIYSEVVKDLELELPKIGEVPESKIIKDIKKTDEKDKNKPSEIEQKAKNNITPNPKAILKPN